MPADDDFYYEGFSSPNGTIVPDDVFDVLAPRLKESELRVLLYIVRRTFGFGKNSDAISLSQMTDGITTRDGRTMDHGTGMSKRAVIEGVKGLVTKGIIEVDRRKDEHGHNAVNIYRLRFRSGEGVVTESNTGGEEESPPVVNEGHPQETVSQETDSHNNTGVVDEKEDSVRNSPLYERLKEAGIHHNTAAALLEKHSQQRIERVIEHVRKRIASGWIPNQSAAAWIVAAIRDEYDLASDHQEQWVQNITPEEAAKLSEEQEKQLQQKFSQAREEKAAALVGDVTIDRVWLQIQEEMKEEGTWAPVLASSFLKFEDSRAFVLVPEVVCDHAEGVQDQVARALESTDLISRDIKNVEMETYKR